MVAEDPDPAPSPGFGVGLSSVGLCGSGGFEECAGVASDDPRCILLPKHFLDGDCAQCWVKVERFATESRHGANWCRTVSKSRTGAVAVMLEGATTSVDAGPSPSRGAAVCRGCVRRQSHCCQRCRQCVGGDAFDDAERQLP